MVISRKVSATSAQVGRTSARWIYGHRRWVTIVLVLIAALAIAARAGLLLSQTTPLSGIQPISGHGYVASLKEPSFPWAPFFTNRGDTNERPTRSSLQLFEDGKPLPHPHAVHADIRERGEGRFSHWGADGSDIVFSALDNANPLTSGRTYAARHSLHLRGPLFTGAPSPRPWSCSISPRSDASGHG